MKAFRNILILGVLALWCIPVQAQVLNRINRSVQNAAQNAAERAATKKAEEEVTKAIEKAFEATEKSEAEKKEAAAKSAPEPYTGPMRGGVVDAVKFPFEHGSYIQAIEALGIEMTTTVYFTRSGEWQAIEDKSEIKFFGISTKVDKLHIIKGNQHWDLDLAEKTGTYYTIDSTPEEADAVLKAALGGEPTEGMEITELGQENYLGYPCRKVHIKYPALDMDVTCLSYGTLIMKNEGRIGPIRTSVKILSVDTSAAPPASKFEVPAGIHVDK